MEHLFSNNPKTIFSASNRDASGAGFAANLPAQPVPRTRTSHVANLSVSGLAAGDQRVMRCYLAHDGDLREHRETGFTLVPATRPYVQQYATRAMLLTPWSGEGEKLPSPC
jgi:hypothetical protein